MGGNLINSSNLAVGGDGKPNPSAYQLISFWGALNWAIQNNVLLMVDPKRDSGADGSHAYEQEWVIAAVLMQACKLNGLPNIAIKTNRSPSELRDLVSPYLREHASYFEFWQSAGECTNFDNLMARITVSAITHAENNDTDPVTTVVNKIKAWENSPYNVINYEIQTPSNQHPLMKPFTKEGITADNILHFVSQYTHRRPSIWIVEPLHRLGFLGRNYNLSIHGNTLTNDRQLTNSESSFYHMLSYDHVINASIITDSPCVVGNMFDPQPNYSC